LIMDALKGGTIGILPAGALGVSFFYHLTRRLMALDGAVRFVERKGSKSSEALKKSGGIRIADRAGIHEIPLPAVLHSDLLNCYERDDLPEIILVCPNPDQLLGVITSCVELLERIYERGQLETALLPFPKVILSSNGIYFQRIRQLFIEKLEEATLLGRLPDLWPDLMPAIVGRLLRGVTIQTGLREGIDAEAIYHPGEPGITRLAGGDVASRERCFQVLASRGAWFELAAHSSATRLEFDKAMINLSANFLGQIYAIDEAGHFRSLTVEQIFVPAHEAEMRDLARHIFQVGLAVRAYDAPDNFETIFAQMMATSQMHREHVPSSLQWIGLKLRLGQLQARMTPTESWLIDPLIRYARSSGLDSAAIYFENMKERLLKKLALAVETAGAAGSSVERSA
jgi:hypothetical protein